MHTHTPACTHVHAWHVGGGPGVAAQLPQPQVPQPLPAAVRALMKLPGELGQARSLSRMLSLSWGVPVVQSPVSPQPSVPCHHSHSHLDVSECSWQTCGLPPAGSVVFFGGGKGNLRVSSAAAASQRDKDLGLLRRGVLLASLLCKRKSCCWGFVITCLLPVLTKPCREKGIWGGLKYLILAGY